ncbi:MAG: hypothetical protein P9L97_00705 [Candidatus Tenebribacter davisii]|nr:hypothetical protein [Candidatus Tenebribacter davisii]
MKKKDYIIFGLIILVILLLVTLLISCKNTANTYELIPVSGSKDSKGGYILLNTKTGTIWNYDWNLNRFVKTRERIG